MSNCRKCGKSKIGETIYTCDGSPPAATCSCGGPVFEKCECPKIKKPNKKKSKKRDPFETPRLTKSKEAFYRKAIKHSAHQVISLRDLEIVLDELKRVRGE